ncbi:MAG: 2-oxoglutarate dehydrogenase complex dihydrolipoyllysine-residue succinyltransferase [Hyphomonas sp.]|uniref:2-oxoglutarate dehydrogenase complex dihydrolipoyllysine-residue succinyltransferase n=1 Tax=Hyphomonas sp. TaxID=87 RepID=UPI0018558890|nr:2-oxoglutarate dehydrogenase complex dihydrolipoyllysine-residue succinyltransferase [Hyphomonas sp.]MBA3068507.1 2-oxoglutarate dehydrogenase complex dihydrolipoyllysine-residue succinyltransferase [Hyphomonas sp.]MBU4060625.1 2-oxoglutarate dehydrogenase complex dihydrolipoyllysine-residue succinyltransferase [Alphaproteobacteria bacterium]MBU4164609.1 2-oxoglutarate dehydrogenase complex dihydrolipoyllysine-residue succinyltransferase [Alphaproteobacteria bacterium]
MTDIVVPTLGESVTEATVGRWLKSKGDAVKKDDVLVELETDKVSVEVSASEDGVLSDIAVPEGETVGIGALLGRINGAGAAAKPAPAAKPAAAPAPAQAAAAPVAAAATGGLTDVKVPVMGESVAEGTIASFSKKVGDKVRKDETIAEIETDKVALEVPSPADGVIVEILVAEGASVTPGSVIARVGASVGAAAPKVAAEAAPAKTAAAPASTGERPVAPSVRRIAAEANVSPAEIPGTGRDGRATKSDALAYVNQPKVPSMPDTQVRPPRETGPREERVRMTRLRQTIARRLKEAQDTAAMLTTFNDVDMSAVMDLRKKHQDAFVARHGIKLGFMSFFVKAVTGALKEVPAVNAEIDGQDLIYKNYYDIGVAVGTEKGLVVPVVRGTDDMSLADIEKAIAALGKKARDGALTIGDLQGGTFTISNGGIYGSLMSTPILNPPQSGVLGMHRIEDRPIVRNGQIVIRPMMYLALSYDHRIVDGKEAVTFLVRVKEALEDPDRMLLEV